MELIHSNALSMLFVHKTDVLKKTAVELTTRLCFVWKKIVVNKN